MKKSVLIILGILTIFVIAFFFLDRDILNTDEGIRIKVAQEMYNSGELFQPTMCGWRYYNKLPFSTWLNLAGVSIFGFENYAVRSVQIFLGVILLISTTFFSYKITKELSFSLFTAFLLISCPLIFEQMIAVNTDLTLLVLHVFNLALFWWWYFIVSSEQKNKKSLCLCSLLIAFCFVAAFLTKTVMSGMAPLIFFVFLICQKKVGLVFSHFKSIFLSFLLAITLLASFFYLYMQGTSFQEVRHYLFDSEIVNRAVVGMHNQEKSFYYLKMIWSGGAFLPFWLFICATAFGFYQGFICRKEVYKYLFFASVLPIVLFSLVKSYLPWYILVAFPPYCLLASSFFLSLTKVRRFKVREITVCVLLLFSYNQLAFLANKRFSDKNLKRLTVSVDELKEVQEKQEIAFYNWSAVCLEDPEILYYFELLGQRTKKLSQEEFERAIKADAYAYYILPYEVLKKFSVQIKGFKVLRKKDQLLLVTLREKDLLPSMQKIFQSKTEDKIEPFTISEKYSYVVSDPNRSHLVVLRPTGKFRKTYVKINGKRYTCRKGTTDHVVTLLPPKELLDGEVIEIVPFKQSKIEVREINYLTEVNYEFFIQSLPEDASRLVNLRREKISLPMINWLQ